MNTLKKHWPWVVTVIGGMIAFLTPSVQAYAASHAQSSTFILTLWPVVCHLLPSPTQQG